MKSTPDFSSQNRLPIKSGGSSAAQKSRFSLFLERFYFVCAARCSPNIEKDVILAARVANKKYVLKKPKIEKSP
jgi:hypothetical protein